MAYRTKTIIIVPCFNEADRLRSEVFLDFLKNHPGIRFLFVNDGSSDRTPDILSNLKAYLPDYIEILTLEKNSGKADFQCFQCILSLSHF